MLDILTSGGLRFCDRLSRREALRVGGLGALGVGLPDLLQSQAAASPTARGPNDGAFGKAKRVILLFMWGGPAHQDTWDLKPHGPSATKGEFLPIGTNVPGIHISEHFPLIAGHADKLAIIRSVAQEDNNHSTGAHAGLTGRRHEVQAENFGARNSDFPHYGAVLSKLQPNPGGLPTFVSLPNVIATMAGAVTPGQGGGILGKKYEPFRISDYPDRLDFSISSLKLPHSVNDLRMHRRRSLLSQIEQAARVAERSTGVQEMDTYYRQALDMVLSPRTRQAFDMAAVSEEERWRYGWHTFGQSVLLARRLIESGVKLVTVYWHKEKRTVDSSWDTHALNFQELKNRLMPSADRPIAALLHDLEDRGLLDETLVIWNSEFGRTPRINQNAGRDHWGPCNSVVMAGGGVPGGQVYGATDEQAAYPLRDRVTQDDIAATIYHLLGINPATHIRDNLNRPFPIALGQPIRKLLGGETRPSAESAAATRVKVPEIGPFTRMLMERGNRFLTCDFGNRDSEQHWELTGWSQPLGEGPQRHRTTSETSPAVIKYRDFFYGHFDYGLCVFLLAEPRPLREIQLTLHGRAIPLPSDLVQQKPQILWQIPFPQNWIKSAKEFTLKIEAPGWQVTDFALVGERIRELHLARLDAADKTVQPGIAG